MRSSSFWGQEMISVSLLKLKEIHVFGYIQYASFLVEIKSFYLKFKIKSA